MPLSDEFWKTIGIIATMLLGSRMWSRSEHKQGQAAGKQQGLDIKEIKLYFNGEMEKKLEEAREQGRQEERSKLKS